MAKAKGRLSVLSEKVDGGKKLFGTIGALPPHLMSAEDRSKNYDRKDLYVDVGYPAEKVRELVHVGDLVTFNVPATPLLNGQFASKTMDDRSCVGCLLLAAERLQKMQHMCDLYFVCSSQEEVGGRGAAVAAYTVDPDLAVVLDVPYDSEGSAVGVSKGNGALLAAVNLAIKAAIDDGSMAQFVADANAAASGSIYEGLLSEDGTAG